MTLVQQSPKPRIIVLGIFLALFSYVLANIIFRVLSNFTNLSVEAVMLLAKITLWIFFYCIGFYAAKIEQQPLILWKEKEYSIGIYLLSIIAILGALFFGLTLVFFIVKIIGLPISSSKRLNELIPIFKRNKFLLVLTALTAGVTEELIFRAYLMPRLELLFKNRYMPIILSSLLFGFMHITYGTFAQVLGPLYIGTVFGIYYYKFRNIKVLIICHFLWDLFALFSQTKHS